MILYDNFEGEITCYIFRENFIEVEKLKKKAWNMLIKVIIEMLLLDNYLKLLQKYLKVEIKNKKTSILRWHTGCH